MTDGSTDERRSRRRVLLDLAVIVLACLTGVAAVGVAAATGGTDWAWGSARLATVVVGGGIGLWFTWARTRVDPDRTGRGLMSPRGGWLDAATAVEDGIRLPGRPTRHGCDLVVRSSDVVAVAGTTSVEFPWDEFRVWPGPFILRSAIPDPSHEGDSWSVAPFSADRGEGPIGIGIEVTGRNIELTAQLRKARRTTRNTLGRATLQGVRIPLVSTWSIDALLDAERTTIAALCQVLAERPEVRARLEDPERVERLLDDMKRRPLVRIAEIDPIARRPFEINAALKRLGYTHRYLGRPLPDDPIPTRQDVLDQVTHELRTGPYTRDLPIESSQILEIVRERYLLEPWPFTAVLE